MTVSLDRDALVLGLRELIAKLHDIDAPARIRIVGGAAISLLYNAERGSTVDIDAELAPADVILGASRHIADNHGWPGDYYAGEEFNARAVAVVEYALANTRVVESPSTPRLSS